MMYKVRIDDLRGSQVAFDGTNFPEAFKDAQRAIDLSNDISWFLENNVGPYGVKWKYSDDVKFYLFEREEDAILLKLRFG